jgi:hypothetical protein
MHKTKLKLNFVDFWPNFRKNDNYFFHLLSTKYQVEIDENDPDLLFFSVDYSKAGERYRYFDKRCKKIFYTGENTRPNFQECDMALTFDYTEDKRNYRLPLWSLFINWFNTPHSEERDISYLIPLQDLTNPRPQRWMCEKTKFCNFVFSNPGGKRLGMLEELSCYKKVDSAGKLKNNMGSTIPGRGDQRYKVDFLKNYKFTIAFENTSYEGYTTEKLIHPLSVGSIPIYWGSERVGEDFNEKAIINVNKFAGLDEVVDYIEEIDTNDNLYRDILSQPIFNRNKIPDAVLPKSVLSFIEERI